MIKIITDTVLLVVDMQNDFCEDGALPAENTTSLLPPLNNYIKKAFKENVLIIYTQDWHSKQNCSFLENGGKWPKHCVKGTFGAELHKDLYLPPLYIIVHKGVEDNIVGYSAFDHTRLKDFLNIYNIKNVIVCGLVTSVCVAQSALASKELGYRTSVVKNLTRDPTSYREQTPLTWELLEKNNIIII